MRKGYSQLQQYYFYQYYYSIKYRVETKGHYELFAYQKSIYYISKEILQ